MTTMKSNTTHALLSASSSHRWLNCTPSARLEETLPESQSNYAEEGRLAHEIAELKLRKQFIEPMGPRAFNNRLKKLQENPLYQPEMLTHTDTYFDYIAKTVHGFMSPPYVAIEKRINYNSYAQQGFGTCDCIIIGGNTMHIIDFKYGTGVPVFAEGNPQMRLYALGAYTEYSFLFDVRRVVMVIVQPRLDTISESELAIEDLLVWGESIKPIATMAFKGEGEFKSGEWCKFCRAKALCRARSEFNLELESYNKAMPPTLSNAEIGTILVRAQQLAKWASDLEEYALAAVLRGEEISGWKAVHGRGKRAFINTDEAFKVLIGSGYDQALLYKREPLSPAQIEDLIGKKIYKDLLTAYVDTPPGKPTLVLESDMREAIMRMTAEQAFGPAKTTEIELINPTNEFLNG